MVSMANEIMVIIFGLWAVWSHLILGHFLTFHSRTPSIFKSGTNETSHLYKQLGFLVHPISSYFVLLLT